MLNYIDGRMSGVLLMQCLSNSFAEASEKVKFSTLNWPLYFGIMFL